MKKIEIFFFKKKIVWEVTGNCFFKIFTLEVSLRTDLKGSKAKAAKPAKNNDIYETKSSSQRSFDYTL